MNQNQTFATVIFDGNAQPVAIGTRLSVLLHEDMPCGGHGKCGKCRVIAKGALSPLSDSEKKFLSVEDIASGVRLACLTTVEGDCEISREKTGETGDNQIVTDGKMPAFVPDPTFANYGVAIDIGTTPLAARLYDPKANLLAETSMLNPQSECGADVVSRIEAWLKGESDRLAGLICGAIDQMIADLAQKSGVPADRIDAVVVTGNTTMLYLLTKTSVEPLSHAPFDAPRLFGETLTAQTLGLASLSPATGVYFPPCISAFVGADTVCALLSTEICAKSETAVLVDIGTNGEMGLWHDGQLTVTSTAAGPAFEGVGISMGMRGGPGAIDRVTVEDGELSAHVIGGGEPVGICGSGLIDAVACLLETEILDETGYLEDDEAVIADPVTLTDQDIRMVQLAKSAIHAGLKTMLIVNDVENDQVATLYVAGGFGEYLDMESAGKIGLLPVELTRKVKVVGNAALSGASMLLLNKKFRADCSQLSQNAKVQSLAANPIFADEYMEGMMF